MSNQAWDETVHAIGGLENLAKYGPAALERARVVAVLDGWAREDKQQRSWTSGPREGGPIIGRGSADYWCTLRGVESAYYWGHTEDAARKASADAIEKGDV